MTGQEGQDTEFDYTYENKGPMQETDKSTIEYQQNKKFFVVNASVTIIAPAHSGLPRNELASIVKVHEDDTYDVLIKQLKKKVQKVPM